MDELIAYIHQLRVSGLNLLEIKGLCVGAGYQPADVVRAISQVYKLPLPPSPKSITAKNKAFGSVSLWLSFEYILQFISLYVMAISLGILLSSYVGYWLPDVVMDYAAYSPTPFDRLQALYSTIQACTAAQLVSWPLFTFFFYFIKRKELDSPAIRDLVSRKILIYLTLIVTFVVMIINLIMVVNSMLDGSITSRFIANSAIILSIAGTIFWYYLGQVRQDRAAQLDKHE